MYDITENALRSKSKKEALVWAWTLFSNKIVVNEKHFSFEFTLSNLKIATGPLYFGFTLSLIVLVLEIFKNILIQTSNTI